MRGSVELSIQLLIIKSEDRSYRIIDRATTSEVLSTVGIVGIEVDC